MRRQQAHIKPTDLGALTIDIASAFRSAIQAAGLRFRIECDPTLPLVPVDRDMWEKIVSNLLANAFKFTFEGEIVVELRALSLHAELVVTDTGIGIPDHELPNLFKRFHRVRGARARTVEGAGIGLAIVDDLVKRLGGQLRVRSTENKGTEFTIWLPYKSFRIPSEVTLPAHSLETGVFASELAREASRWLFDTGEAPPEVLDDLVGPSRGLASSSNEAVRQGRIVVADDNADMREYLLRLLRPHWEVELAADGEAALKAARRDRPDLLLTDVMMSGLDGFQLMERIREDPQLKHTPVVLLTARAGEEAAIQGLLAGADDYIAKPFSPRELLVRVQAVIDRSRIEAALRDSEEKYRTLFTSIDEGFCTIEVLFDENERAVDYRFLQVNPSFERQTGIENAVGRRMREIAPQHEEHWFDIYGRVAQTGAPIRFEGEARELGNRMYDVYAFRVDEPKLRRVGLQFNDITERKQREWQQEYLLKLSDALRPLADAVAIQETVTCTMLHYFAADRCYYCEIENDVAVIRRDAARDGLPSVANVYPLSSLPIFKAVIDAGKPVIVSDVAITDTMEEALRQLCIQMGIISFIDVPVIKGGVPVGILCITQTTPREWIDVEVKLAVETAERTWAAVERARAEVALRASEVRFRTLADAVPQVIWTNEADGKATYFNERWFSYSGLSLEASLGPGWQAIVHPDDAPASFERWQEALAAGTVFDTEYRLRRADGVYRWFIGRNVPLHDDAGRIIGWFGSATDIEELKQAEEVLQRAHDELEQRVAQRTAELQRLSSTRLELLQSLITAQEDERRRIARELHDSLGQYLSALSINLARVQTAEDVPPMVRADLARLQTLASEIDDELDQLTMELRPPGLDDLGLDDALRQYIQEWSATSGIDAEVVASGFGGARVPLAVEATAYRVVQEALTNVRKHAHARHVSAILERRADMLRVIVEDDGIGFDPEVVARERSGGQQLGLVGMRERASLAGGAIMIESEPGSGTTIYLLIPLNGEHAERSGGVDGKDTGDDS